MSSEPLPQSQQSADWEPDQETESCNANQTGAVETVFVPAYRVQRQQEQTQRQHEVVEDTESSTFSRRPSTVRERALSNSRSADDNNQDVVDEGE